MKPLRDICVIELEEKQDESKTASGLYMPKEKWEKPQNVGVILSTGPEVIHLKKGDKVVFNPYAAIDTDEKTKKLIKEVDVLCSLAAK